MARKKKSEPKEPELKPYNVHEMRKALLEILKEQDESHWLYAHGTGEIVNANAAQCREWAQALVDEGTCEEADFLKEKGAKMPTTASGAKKGGEEEEEKADPPAKKAARKKAGRPRKSPPKEEKAEERESKSVVETLRELVADLEENEQALALAALDRSLVATNARLDEIEERLDGGVVPSGAEGVEKPGMLATLKEGLLDLANSI